MSDTSHIEWTDATWNPTTGCTKISPGCLHCYIDRTPPFRMAGRTFVKGKIPVELHADRLDKPLHWRKPRRVFVNSLSDLFHESIPDEFIDRVFAVMALCPQHTFQVLTKRAERMAGYMASRSKSSKHWESACPSGYALRWEHAGTSHPLCPFPLPNVWLGVSAEDQQRLNERVPWVVKTPAAVRFLSCEPLLGALTFRWAKWCPWPYNEETGVTDELDGLRMLDWVIVGGESGPGARPMHPDWARTIRDQCEAAGVPFFFKQWGEWAPACPEHGIGGHVMPTTGRTSDGTRVTWIGGNGELKHPSGHGLIDPVMAIARVGKKSAGRLLDGIEHNAFPEPTHAV